MKQIKGKTWDEMMKMEMSEKMLPSSSVASDVMPEIQNWEVGKEYEMKVRVRLSSKHEDMGMSHACLDLVAYEDLTDNKPDPSTPKMSTDGGYMPKK